MTLKHLFEWTHLSEVIAVLTVRRFSAPVGVLLGLAVSQSCGNIASTAHGIPEEGVYSTTQQCQTLA